MTIADRIRNIKNVTDGFSWYPDNLALQELRAEIKRQLWGLAWECGLDKEPSIAALFNDIQPPRGTE